MKPERVHSFRLQLRGGWRRNAGWGGDWAAVSRGLVHGDSYGARLKYLLNGVLKE